MNRLRATAIATALSGAVLLAKGLWIPAKAELAYGLMDRALDQVGSSQSPSKPWSWADFKVVGKLQLLGEDVHVLDRATNQAMAFGAGLHEEYGEDGPVVFSGHRDTHFSMLARTKLGDVITYQNLGTESSYEVTDTRIFDIREGVLQPPSPGQIMLITCWPFDGIDPNTTKRYLVLAEQNTAESPIRQRPTQREL